MVSDTQIDFSKTDWSIIKDSNVFFDSCSIIKLVEFQAHRLMAWLGERNAVPCLILPTYLEILRANDFAIRNSRQLFLDRHKFRLVVHQERFINEPALRLQEELHSYQCHPEPADLYLGAHIKRSIGSNYLMSANAKHFPYPVYKKLGFFILSKEDEVSVHTLFS